MFGEESRREERRVYVWGYTIGMGPTMGTMSTMDMGFTLARGPP